MNIPVEKRGPYPIDVLGNDVDGWWGLIPVTIFTPAEAQQVASGELPAPEVYLAPAEAKCETCHHCVIQSRRDARTGELVQYGRRCKLTDAQISRRRDHAAVCGCTKHVARKESSKEVENDGA